MGKLSNKRKPPIKCKPTPNPQSSDQRTKNSSFVIQNGYKWNIKIDQSDNNRKGRGYLPNESDIKTSSSNEEENPTNVTLLMFPSWLPWLLVVFTLCCRLVYVQQPKNWWILHPDEVYQTIEVAHTEVYAYGFRPYEFLPPPENDVINRSISGAHAQEIRLGMFSLRSFLLPKLLSLILFAVDWFGTTSSPYIVIKLFHVTVTSFLPLSVYRFVRTFYHCRDTASLAAIFASSSLCLNVFGTHSLTNSFVSPILFFALEPLIRILQSIALQSRQCQTGCKSDSRSSTGYTKTRSKSFENIPSTDKSDFSTSGSSLTMSNGDENGNFNKFRSLNKCSGEAKSKLKDCGSKIYEAFNHFPNLKDFNEVMCGALLACCIYIRIDTIAIPVMLTLVNMEHIPKCIRQLVSSFSRFGAGIFIGLLLGGYSDFIYYDSWFISPVQWFNFNVLSQTSGAIFGVSPSFYYISKLVEDEPIILICAGIVSVSILLEIHITYQYKQFKNSKSYYRCIYIFIILMTLYSGNKHKEMRFLHNTIVFFYMIVARAILILFKAIPRFFVNQNHSQYSIYYVWLFISLFTSSHLYTFHNFSKYDKSKWSYSGSYDSDEVNSCLDFIRQQNDVSGVFIDRPLHLTGGYSILHKDVPLFAINRYEFMEFDNDSKLTIGKIKNFFGYNTVKQVNVFGRISDFISIYNSPYLLKQLIMKKEYNYLVLRKDREFENTGYNKVFETGNSRVLKRSFDTELETKMADRASRIPIGSNATILEYEGDWLVHFGLYRKAEQRLLLSNKLNSTRIGPFRVLLRLYRKLGVAKSYESVLQACVQVYPMDYCLSSYTPIQLHSDYFRGTDIRNN